MSLGQSRCVCRLGDAAASAPGRTDGSDYQGDYSEQRKHDREDKHRREPPRMGLQGLVVVAQPDHSGGKVKNEAGEKAGNA